MSDTVFTGKGSLLSSDSSALLLPSHGPPPYLSDFPCDIHLSTRKKGGRPYQSERQFTPGMSREGSKEGTPPRGRQLRQDNVPVDIPTNPRPRYTSPSGNHISHDPADPYLEPYPFLSSVPTSDRHAVLAQAIQGSNKKDVWKHPRSFDTSGVMRRMN